MSTTTSLDVTADAVDEALHTLWQLSLLVSMAQRHGHLDLSDYAVGRHVEMVRQLSCDIVALAVQLQDAGLLD